MARFTQTVVLRGGFFHDMIETKLKKKNLDAAILHM